MNYMRGKHYLKKKKEQEEKHSIEVDGWAYYEKKINSIISQHHPGQILSKSILRIGWVHSTSEIDKTLYNNSLWWDRCASVLLAFVTCEADLQVITLCYWRQW